MVPVLIFMKNLVNPRTKAATAFYFALGISGWDVVSRGFNRYNAAVLAALAIPGLVGAAAHLLGAGRDEPPDSPPSA
jgi:hypothetical protein